MANNQNIKQKCNITKIKCSSLNICGLSDRSRFALNKFINDENIAILALQETGAFCDDTNELLNMNMIMDKNESRNKGVALYVNDKYSITKLDDISNISKKMDSCWGLIIV